MTKKTAEPENTVQPQEQTKPPQPPVLEQYTVTIVAVHPLGVNAKSKDHAEGIATGMFAAQFPQARIHQVNVERNVK